MPLLPLAALALMLGTAQPPEACRGMRGQMINNDGARTTIVLSDVERCLEVRVAGPRHLGLTLATLGPVEFSGTLRTRATVGAAALGAVVTGPFAPVGAFAGYMLADRYIERRSQREVETQLKAALSLASTLPLVPVSATIVSGWAG